nr:integrase, catalytic region, zinc finger, CCHC-type, peptidase aspartic, catalytic [Tanacetum cinerariifolium]
MIVDSVENGPYVRRMIATPGEPDLPVLVLESLHEQTDKELTENNIKRMDVDDQAIQTILLGLPEDVYAVVDSCETAKEIWECVRQMMKGSDIGEQEKKAKLFNEWESSRLLTGNRSNRIIIVRQTKNLHEADFTQIYDFLKINHEEVNELRAKRLAKSHDPLALMDHSQNSFNFPTTHKDQSSSSTHPQQSFPINNKYNPQPPLNQNFMQPQMTSFEDINDPTEAINAALILFAKAFQLSAPTKNNQRTSSNPRNRFNAWQNGRIQGAQNAGVQSGGNQNGLVIVLGIANQSGTGNVVAARAEGTRIENQAKCYNCSGLGHITRNCTARPRRRDAAYLQTQLLIAQKEEAGIQLQAEEFDFMAAAGDLDEIEEVNANCILMANLQHASTFGTQPDRAPVYDTDGSAEVHLNDNCMVHSGGTVETSSAPNEKIRAHQETVYRNLVDQVAQKLESKIVELEFQVVNYEREISHLKTTYKNLFNSIKSNRAHAKLHDLIYENAKLRARLFENTSKSVKNISGTSVTPHVDKPKLSDITPLFKISPSQTPRVDLVPNKQSSASIRTNLITNSQRHVTVKENVSSNTVTASSTGLVHTARTKRPQPKGNTKNVRVHSASKSSEVKKSVTVEDHRRTLLLSMNQKTMSSECLGHNLFSLGQFCDADLEVAFRRNTCFIRDLDGVELLKGNHSTNLYTINLYDMASASPICRMARATPTKSWLWHQRL